MMVGVIRLLTIWGALEGTLTLLIYLETFSSNHCFTEIKSGSDTEVVFDNPTRAAA